MDTSSCETQQDQENEQHTEQGDVHIQYWHVAHFTCHSQLEPVACHPQLDVAATGSPLQATSSHHKLIYSLGWIDLLPPGLPQCFLNAATDG
jgi:hypothetical protein